MQSSPTPRSFARRAPAFALAIGSALAGSALLGTGLAPPALAFGSASGSASGVLEPAEIDRAVRAFTGAGVGEIGGARAPADPRLRLAACAHPLATSWHGTRRAAVKVECTRTQGQAPAWRIFVATLPGPAAQGAAQGATRTARALAMTRSAPLAPIIKRGDPVTVVVRGRGFTVQQPGEALTSGVKGDWIGIRTARRADPVRARIERPGLAIIPIQ